jgi:hypothetical protein
MDHMSQTQRTCGSSGTSLPIKSDRVFKKQLQLAGVLMMDESGEAEVYERTVSGKRVGHMVGLSLEALRQYGLHAVVPMEKFSEPSY